MSTDYSRPFAKIKALKFQCATASALMTASFDVDLDRIRRLAIHNQHDIHVAASGQTARHAHINLIEAGKAALRSGIQQLSISAANLGRHMRRPAVVTQTR